MEKKLIFNENGSDDISKRKLIGGDTTNLLNLNNTKYKWANGLYKVMQGNFWIPEVVPMLNDEKDYKNLTKEEKQAYDETLAFLIFLDSLQTINLPNISDYITAPEVSILLAIQTFQEAIHTKSYAHIVESVIPPAHRDKIYGYNMTDKVLLGRNKFIASIYQNFVDDPTEETFVKVVIANYILEGLYFYNGFNFFYSLSARNLMSNTADQIRYIQRDEQTHVALFTHIIKTLQKENPGLVNSSMVYEMFDEAVNMEIDWCDHILGDKILGITLKSSEQYTKYLANMRLNALGFRDLYEEPEFKVNPYKHLNSQAGEDSEVKANFFEARVTDYSRDNVIDKWEEI